MSVQSYKEQEFSTTLQNELEIMSNSILKKSIKSFITSNNHQHSSFLEIKYDIAKFICFNLSFQVDYTNIENLLENFTAFLELSKENNWEINVFYLRTLENYITSLSTCLEKIKPNLNSNRVEKILTFSNAFESILNILNVYNGDDKITFRINSIRQFYKKAKEEIRKNELSSRRLNYSGCNYYLIAAAPDTNIRHRNYLNNNNKKSDFQFINGEEMNSCNYQIHPHLNNANNCNSSNKSNNLNLNKNLNNNSNSNYNYICSVENKLKNQSDENISISVHKSNSNSSSNNNHSSSSNSINDSIINYIPEAQSQNAQSIINDDYSYSYEPEEEEKSFEKAQNALSIQIQRSNEEQSKSFNNEKDLTLGDIANNFYYSNKSNLIRHVVSLDTDLYKLIPIGSNSLGLKYSNRKAEYLDYVFYPANIVISSLFLSIDDIDDMISKKIFSQFNLQFTKANRPIHKINDSILTYRAVYFNVFENKTFADIHICRKRYLHGNNFLKLCFERSTNLKKMHLLLQKVLHVFMITRIKDVSFLIVNFLAFKYHLFNEEDKKVIESQKAVYNEKKNGFDIVEDKFYFFQYKKSVLKDIQYYNNINKMFRDFFVYFRSLIMSIYYNQFDEKFPLHYIDKDYLFNLESLVIFLFSYIPQDKGYISKINELIDMIDNKTLDMFDDIIME